MNKAIKTCKALGNTKRLLILKFVKESNSSFEEIRSQLNANNNTITFHLRKLYDAQLITISSVGNYCITNYGKKVLAFERKLENIKE